MTSNNKGRHLAGRGPRLDPKVRMVIMIVLAVIMVIIASLCVLYNRWVKKPTLPSADNPNGGQTVESGAVSSGDIEEGPVVDAVQPKVGGERKSADFYTILVFGEDESSGLTDTIMVVSYDVTNQKATVMSIPRDTIINSSATYVTGKLINAVYKRYGGEKGIEALKSEVSELIGFTPDYYVKINWELVGQMVDAIGGVWYEVPWDMWYADAYQDLYIDLEEGYQLLNGDQAMQLVRWRKNMNKVTFSTVGEKSVSDLNRLEMQHDFLKAVLKQTLQIQNVTKISKLAELFGENVISDLSIENLFWFGSQAIFGGLSVDDVNFVTMPVLGTTAEAYKSHVYPNWSQLLSLINESLNPYVTNVTMKELDLIRVNDDGTLTSSTGVLADPSAAIPPVTETEQPTDDPEPVDTDPVDPGPEDSAPVTTEPVDPDPDVTEPDPPPAVSEEPPINDTSAGE